MIKGGKGGARTQSGLTFETRADLRVVFEKINGYKVEGNDLLFNGKKVAQLFKKHELYKAFLPELQVDWEQRISKKLLPDESVFVLTNKTLFIIEMKFQEVAGSVDEKLQTCDFKKKQYEKLVKGTGVKVEYCYILNEWFQSNAYKDTLAYIKEVGCHYFFGVLPLDFLGLPN